ncbi:hypothetical protein AAFF_G00021300 [Aldrovandia affinis]|uniref:Uncharacterized protein n=1 Tax=Aldrovandia affinis TaxID=143900 RepID=A0AAD7S5C9_9TELE|nr:hypothetical protein AAFF_G00021300 [Aldrovandia affinis]
MLFPVSDSGEQVLLAYGTSSCPPHTVETAESVRRQASLLPGPVKTEASVCAVPMCCHRWLFTRSCWKSGPVGLWSRESEEGRGLAVAHVSSLGPGPSATRPQQENKKTCDRGQWRRWPLALRRGVFGSGGAPREGQLHPADASVPFTPSPVDQLRTPEGQNVPRCRGYF